MKALPIFGAVLVVIIYCGCTAVQNHEQVSVADKNLNPTSPSRSEPSPEVSPTVQKEFQEERDRDLYRNQMMAGLSSAGYDIVVAGRGGRLIFSGAMFENTADRVEFLRGLRVEPLRTRLCKLGFRTIVISTGIFSSNKDYSLACAELNQ